MSGVIIECHWEWHDTEDHAQLCLMANKIPLVAINPIGWSIKSGECIMVESYMTDGDGVPYFSKFFRQIEHGDNLYDVAKAWAEDTLRRKEARRKETK